METKNLKHRKRQKKRKSGIDKGNTDVLVVPPDILKKLGISIGNTNIPQEVLNVGNNIQYKSSDNDELVTRLPTEKCHKISSNSSIIETANLMKKSVFLSPTFVPTISNMIPGEVEISNVQSHNDTAVLSESFASENINNTFVHYDTKTKENDERLKGDDNLGLNIDGRVINTIIESNNQNHLGNNEIDLENCQITNSQYKDVSRHVNINGSSPIKAKDPIKICNLIVGDTTGKNFNSVIPSSGILDNEKLVSDTSTSLSKPEFPIDKIIMANNLGASIKIMEQDEIAANYITLEDIHLEEFKEDLITSTKTYQNSNESICANNDSFIIENDPNCTEQSKTPPNINSIADIQGSNIIVMESVEDEIKNVLLECNNMSNMLQADNNEISLKDIGNEIELVLDSNNIIVSEEDALLNKDTKSTGPDMIQNEMLSVDELNNSDHASIEIKYVEKNNNLNYNTGSGNRITQDMENNISLQESKDETNLELTTQTDTQSNFVKDCKVVSSLENINVNMHKNVNTTQNVCNGSLEDIIKNGFDLKAAEQNPVTALTVNKTVQKINIISEEVIPSTELKDLRKSQAPIIKSLTHVPLNTVITPKRNCDDFEIKSVNNEKLTVLSKQNKILDLPDISISSSVINCNNANQTISATNQIPNTTRNYLTIDNNNLEDIRNDDMDTSTVKDSENTNNSSGNNMIHSVGVGMEADMLLTEIPQIQMNGIHYDGMIEGIVNTTQDQSVIDDDNLKINSDKKTLYEKYHPKYQNSKKILNVDQDHKSATSEKEFNPLSEKIEEMKNKVTVAENIHVGPIENKEFYNKQINNIVKSSKENSDENVNLEKVREIAEYIKKYTHIYKDSTRIVNKTEKRRRSINSKANIIKSKLCIQGVEKPGGEKGCTKEVPNKTKVLKTYTRQRKVVEPSTSKELTAINDAIPCNVDNICETDLNTINISMAHKSQDFCLCSDFGRFDTSDYDSSYEHIHFSLPDNNADLEAILSIYNEEDIVTDRTKLVDVAIDEVIETSTKTGNICWNYFRTNDESNNTINNSQDKEVEGSNKNIDEPSASEVSVYSDPEIQQTDSNTELPIDASAQNDIDYEIITIVEVVNDDNVTLETAKTNSEEPTVSNQNGSSNAATTHDIQKESLMNSDGTSKIAKKMAIDSKNSKQGHGETNDKTNSNKRDTVKADTVSTMKQNTSMSMPETSKQGNRKRNLSADNTSEGPCSKKAIKCGVCNKLFSSADWNNHVENKHNHIAWKAGETFDFDDKNLLKKLREKLDAVGSLKCPNCHTQTRKFNKFVTHIKTCMQQKDASSSRRTTKDMVTCAVCQEKVPFLSWNEHIGKKHNYLAWVDGQEALNLEDEAAVTKHLQNIIKCNGSLVCSKCGLMRKRVKLYQTHIETCDGTESPMDDSSICVDTDSTMVEEDTVTDKKTMLCGVCKQEVPVSEWTTHIGKEHNYLAWEDGQTPLNLEDEETVRNHLLEFIRNNGGLRCYKCGLNRKRVKLYLSHIETCDGESENLEESTVEDVSTDQGTSDTKVFECGVCQAKVALVDWNEHIGREHYYLAWKVGDPVLDINDEDAVKEHLLEIIRNCEGLMCYKCGLNRRRVKLYLAHVKNCDGSQLNQSIDSTLNSSQVEISIDANQKIVKCGVCDADVSEVMWIKHIGREHKYLAWKQGEEPLDLENDEVVKEHLLNISRENNGLRCNQCNITKKYPKTFLQHTKDCDGVPRFDDSNIKYESDVSSFDISDVKTDTVVCGVCETVLDTTQWMKHLEHEHNYLAWLQGRPPIDLEDRAAIQRHLIDVSRYTGGLQCKNCGLVRKYAKSYLSHIDYCKVSGNKFRDTSVMTGNDAVTCAVCDASVDPKDWRDHAMKKHYNVAWLVGATPIEINSPYSVEPYIKEYQQKHNNKLVCKTCGITRVSAVGFYAHIIACGKTEEETEIYKSLCEICNTKYLKIYKSQHMTAHREKEYAMERKLLLAKEKELKKDEDVPVEIVGGRRKAAEKAKTVIEKYTSTISDGSNYCSKCGFSSEVETEMSQHVCVAEDFEASDSDESVHLDSSDEEEDDTDIDSNISDEEKEARDRELSKSKRHGESHSANKIKRLPYNVNNITSYMRNSAEQFIALHLTDDDLFTQYRSLDYTIVSETDVHKYMPPIEESCKVKYGSDEEWTTLKRFEARIDKDITVMFTGGSIQNMCWVPPVVGDQSPLHEYLSILSTLGTDTPRHYWYDKPQHKPAVIQIWDCGNFVDGIPQLSMCLALDCGTIWAMEWCPSGARDVFEPQQQSDVRRLGLLSVASADGTAYIFAVPHPCTLKENGLFLKLKPIMELRLAMDSSRKVYQATAIKWSSQKGHAHIVVGYSDGTTAYFDLNNDSPLLKGCENNIDIIYPYHDERAQNMCIEDVGIFPRSCSEETGAVVSASVSGAGSRELHAHAAATRLAYPPHWPAALLAGDDNLVSQAINELEWGGVGRRVGGMRALCGCAWCGRVAASSAPLVRLMRTHPAHDDLHRQIIATLQMVPIGSKRKRKNDELCMIMEPITYEETVQKYGIELAQITAKDKNTQQKLSAIPREPFPERFPLADIVSMAFCPTHKNHNKLALATHAGIIFIITI